MIKFTKKIIMVSLAACLFSAIPTQINVFAAKINNQEEAKALALEKIPNATVTDIDTDKENGVLIYEVDLIKGKKEYKITYRAKDAKILEYEWEKMYVSPSKNKTIIKESKCKTLAEKKVKNGTIKGIVKKTDDGITIYKVKMTDKHKSYTLKYHAGTGALIEYEWKVLKTSSNSSNSNTNDDIGIEKAKQIALNDADAKNAEVIKAEFDTDDGMEVYEIELADDTYEYEYKIDAKTGEILEQEKDFND